MANKNCKVLFGVDPEGVKIFFKKLLPKIVAEKAETYASFLLQSDTKSSGTSWHIVFDIYVLVFVYSWHAKE